MNNYAYIVRFFINVNNGNIAELVFNKCESPLAQDDAEIRKRLDDLAGTDWDNYMPVRLAADIFGSQITTDRIEDYDRISNWSKSLRECTKDTIHITDENDMIDHFAYAIRY